MGSLKFKIFRRRRRRPWPVGWFVLLGSAWDLLSWLMVLTISYSYLWTTTTTALLLLLPLLPSIFLFSHLSIFVLVPFSTIFLAAACLACVPTKDKQPASYVYVRSSWTVVFCHLKGTFSSKNTAWEKGVKIFLAKNRILTHVRFQM